jgi:hypothetical protein
MNAVKFLYRGKSEHDSASSAERKVVGNPHLLVDTQQEVRAVTPRSKEKGIRLRMNPRINFGACPERSRGVKRQNPYPRARSCPADKAGRIARGCW